MGTVLGLVFCALFISGKMLIVQSSVYSSPDAALRFSQCIIEKMSESQLFTFRERDDMTEVANTLTETILQPKQTVLFRKIMLIAFVTSMAELIIDEDIAKNIQKKGIYAAAIERCSISSTGYADTEFINEALKIMSVIEDRKVPKFKETGGFAAGETYDFISNPQKSDNFNPWAVKPSRVQNPYAPQFFEPNVRIFEPTENPYFSPFSGLSQSDTKSEYQVQSTSKIGVSSVSGASRLSQSGGFPINSGASSMSKSGGLLLESQDSSMRQYEGFPSDYDDRDMSQSGSLPSSSDASSISQSGSLISGPDTSSKSQSDSDLENVSSSKVLRVGDNINFNDTYQQASFGGLNVPQTKESSVVVISPQNVQQPVQDENLPENLSPETGQIIYQPSSAENSTRPEKSTFSMTPTASLPQTDEQYSNIPSSPTLESLVLNILTNSPTFREAFSPGTTRENVINLARAITEQSLAGYDSNIINEALTTVTDAVAKVSVRSPENYAFALSNALISVLKMNKIPLYADGSQIATSFLSNMGNTKQLPSQTVNFEEQPMDYISGEEVNSEWEDKKVDFDFQSPPLSPEDTDEEIFSETLSRYLSNSEKINICFCSRNFPENRMQILFDIIKSSLVEYGPQISSIAANVASGALSELSAEGLCFNHATIISEVIAEVLDENGVHGANAEDISNKMADSLSQLNLTPMESQKPESESDNFPPVDAGIVPYETARTLQSSFSTNFYESVHDFSTQPTFYESSEDSMTQSFEDTNYGISHNVAEEQYGTGSVSYSTPPSPIQMSSAEEIKPEYQTEYASPAYTTEISDEEIASISAVVEKMFNLSDTSPANSPVSWASDDIIDQEALAEYLFHEFESGLEAFNYKDSDQDESSVALEEILAASETVKNSESDNPQASAEEVRLQPGGRVRPRNSRNRGRRPSVQTGQIGEDFENNKSIISHHGFGSKDTIGGKVDSHSRDSDVKIVELQPSFQGPRQESTDSQNPSAVSEPNSDEFDHEDESISLARTVSQKAASFIDYIRSGKFRMNRLCARLNKLSPIVNIPPLDYCEETAAMDYLLNVLRCVIKKLTGI